MNSNALIRILPLSLLLGLGACSDRSAQTAPVKVEAGEKPSELVSSGRPEAPFIDPQKKSVTILIAPTESQRIEQRHASLQADSERRETAIHDLMDRYSGSMSNSVSKASYEKRIGEELAAYKQRILELHRLQRVTDLNQQPGTAAQ